MPGDAELVGDAELAAIGRMVVEGTNESIADQAICAG